MTAHLASGEGNPVTFCGARLAVGDHVEVKLRRATCAACRTAFEKAVAKDAHKRDLLTIWRAQDRIARRVKKLERRRTARRP